MSLSAIVEVAVHFDEFVNLALFKKGLYRVDAQVFCSLGAAASQGVPYAHFHQPQRDTSTTGPWTTEIEGSDEGQEEPKIANERQSFSTRAINVRYNDEHFLLNDGVYFRVEKPLSTVDEPLLVRLQLCRATVEISDTDGVKRTSKYEVVATEELTIGQASSGAHAYWPLQFDSTNLCLVGVMLHAAVVGVQFREVQLPRSPPGSTESSPRRRPRRKPAPPIPPPSKSLKQRVGGALRGAGGKVKALAQRRRSLSDSSAGVAQVEQVTSAATPALPPTPAATPVPQYSDESLSEPASASVPAAAPTAPPSAPSPLTVPAAADGDVAGDGDTGASSAGPVTPPLRPPSLHGFLFPTLTSPKTPDLFQLAHAHALVVAPLVRSFHGLGTFIASVRQRQAQGPAQAARFSIVPDNPFTSTPSGGAGSSSVGPGAAPTAAPSSTALSDECPPLRVPQSTYAASGDVSVDHVVTMRSDACVRGPWVKGAVDGLGVAIQYGRLESGDPTRGSPSPHSTTGGLTSFSERCTAVSSPEAAAVAIMSEAHIVAEQLFMLWFDLVSLLGPSVGVLGELMQAEWRAQMLAACTTAVVPRYRPASLLDGPFGGEEDAAMLALRADAQADIIAGMESIGVCNHRALDPTNRPIILAESFSSPDTAAGFSDSDDSSDDSSSTPSPPSLPSSSRSVPKPDAADAGKPATFDSAVAAASAATAPTRSPSDSDDSATPVIPRGVPTPLSPSTSASPLHAAAIAAKGVHVIVFQNGLNGYRYDLRLLQSFIKLLFPYHLTLGATSNQASKTEGDIMLMGKRLAEEVHDFVTDNVIAEGLHLRSLSFVGFSLGGVIVRTALRHAAMQQYLPYLKSFITLASPHLGLMYASSALFSTGVYVMRKWKKQLSLAQLACTDAARATDRVLYRLAVGWKPMTAAVDPDASGAPAGTGRSLDDTVPAATPADDDDDLPPVGAAPHDRDGDGDDDGECGRENDVFVDTLAVPEDADVMASAPPPLSRSGSGKDDWGAASPFRGANGGAGAEAMTLRTPGDDIYSSDFMDETAEDAAPSPSALKQRSKLGKLGKRFGRRRGTSSSKSDSDGAGAGGTNDLAATRWRKHMLLQSTGKAFSRRSSSGAVVTEWLARPAGSDKKTADMVRSFSWDPNGQILRRFKHVLLIGSAQDRYTPHHSHRAELCAAATKDTGEQSQAFHHMVHGFWKDVDPARVTKLEVFFPKLGSKLSMDSVLGREAHLAFLESSQLAHILVLCYSELFA